jgi:hypothetical protein
MGKLVIDANDLMSAIASRGSQSFLDRQTGEIVLRGFYTTLSPDEYERYVEGIYGNPERYLPIAPMTAQEWEDLTGSFLDSLPPADAALAKRVFEEPDSREAIKVRGVNRALFGRWGRHRRDRLLELALRWLKEHRIEAELSSAHEA